MPLQAAQGAVVPCYIITAFLQVRNTLHKRKPGGLRIGKPNGGDGGGVRPGGFGGGCVGGAAFSGNGGGDTPMPDATGSGGGPPSPSGAPARKKGSWASNMAKKAAAFAMVGVFLAVAANVNVVS